MWLLHTLIDCTLTAFPISLNSKKVPYNIQKKHIVLTLA